MYPPPLRTFVQAAWSKARSLSLAEFFDGVLLFGVLLVLAIYLSLIPLGHWQGDDYVWAWMIGARDWASYLNALRWAPRPIPQALLAVYFLISDHFQKPLIEAFLVFIWSFAAVIVAAAAGISALRRPVFISFLLLALTLLASPQNELFYWTSAAASYVPCWAALAAATLLQNPASRKAVTALIICLTFATLCSEVAAVVTLVYSAALGITALRWKTPRHFFLLAIPSACAIVVCLAVLDGRMAPMTEIINASSGLAGHWLPSVEAALPAFGLDLIGIPAMPLPIGILCKILLLVGLSFGTAATQSDVRFRLLWSSALLFAAFCTIVLANNQFGVVCCDRHANLRQGMILLALATVSPLFADFRLPIRPALLIAAISLLLAFRAPSIAHDASVLPTDIQARNANWQSGRSLGDAMIFVNAPRHDITGNSPEKPGQYHRSLDQPQKDPLWTEGHWDAWAILALFGKHELLIKNRP